MKRISRPRKKKEFLGSSLETTTAYAQRLTDVCGLIFVVHQTKNSSRQKSRVVYTIEHLINTHKYTPDQVLYTTTRDTYDGNRALKSSPIGPQDSTRSRTLPGLRQGIEEPQVRRPRSRPRLRGTAGEGRQGILRGES